MKNNREIEGPKYKKKKKKKSRNGHVAGRKEGGSFLLFVQLRVIHKKRKKDKRGDILE